MFPYLLFSLLVNSWYFGEDLNRSNTCCFNSPGTTDCLYTVNYATFY